MLELRTHLLTLAAIFLALGIGFLAGTNSGGTRGLLQEEEAMVSRLEGDFARFKQERALYKRALADERRSLEAWKLFGREAQRRLVASRLAGKTIGVVVLDPAFAPAPLVQAIRSASGTAEPVLQATGAPGAASQAEAETLAAWLKAPSGAPPPEAFRQLRPATGPVDGVIIVSGRPAQATAEQAWAAAVVRALRVRGMPVVIGAGGRRLLAAGFLRSLGGVVVEDIQSPEGLVAAVLGFTARPGLYGHDRAAAGLFPA